MNDEVIVQFGMTFGIVDYTILFKHSSKLSAKIFDLVIFITPFSHRTILFLLLFSVYIAQVPCLVPVLGKDKKCSLYRIYIFRMIPVRRRFNTIIVNNPTYLAKKSINCRNFPIYFYEFCNPISYQMDNRLTLSINT